MSTMWPFGDKQSNTKETVFPPPTLSKVLIGVNGQVKFASHGVDYSSPSFRAAIKSMGINGYRVPGGTIANSKLPTEYPLPSDIKLLQTDCQFDTISYVLNMITSTMSEQIAILSEYKRLGVPLGIFEMGNEFNSASFQEMMNRYGSSNNYFTECAKWVVEIKKIFPDSRFSIPGGDKPGREKRDWNKRALTKNPGCLLTWHYHNTEVYTSPAGIVDTQKIETLIDTAKQVEFAGVSASQLALTEINLENEDGGIREQPYFRDEEQKGIAIDFMMRKFYRMGCPVFFFHNVVEAGGNGAVEITATGCSLSATGKAIQKLATEIL